MRGRGRGRGVFAAGPAPSYVAPGFVPPPHIPARHGRGLPPVLPSRGRGLQGRMQVPAPTMERPQMRPPRRGANSSGRGEALPNPAPAGRAKQDAPPICNTSCSDICSFPFDEKTRGVLQHMQRHPHRPADLALYRVLAHWVSIPQGTVPLTEEQTDVTVVIGDKETVPVPPEGEVEDVGKTVNARVLLVPGTKREHAAVSTIASRMQVIACRVHMEKGQELRAYGGSVPAGTDCAMIGSLCKILQEQSGVDLTGVRTWYKLLELQYKDRPPTIFWIPCLWECSTLKVMPQAAEKEYEVEESYVEEVVDEERKRKLDEEYQQKLVEGGDTPEPPATPKKKVRKTRTVLRTKKAVKIAPQSVNLATLVDMAATNASASATRELLSAADALDEFLRREMAGRILSVLRTSRQKMDERQESAKVFREKLQAKKRSLEEELHSAKRARTEQKEIREALWAEEDSGMTDDEKKAAMRERNVIRAEEAQKEREAEAECKRLLRKVSDDMVASEPKRRRWKTPNPKSLEAFRHFDRPKGLGSNPSGSLPVKTLRNMLLSLDEGFSLTDVQSLMGLPQIPPHGVFTYAPLVQEIHEEMVEEKPAATEPGAGAAEPAVKAEAASDLQAPAVDEN